MMLGYPLVCTGVFFAPMAVAIFLLAMDFWARGICRPLAFGLPFRIAYFVLLSALQTAAMAGMLHREFSRNHNVASEV